MTKATDFAARTDGPKFVMMRLGTLLAFILIFAAGVTVPFRGVSLILDKELQTTESRDFLMTGLLNTTLALGAFVLLVAAITSRKIAAIETIQEEYRPFMRVAKRFADEQLVYEVLEMSDPSTDREEKLEVSRIELDLIYTEALAISDLQRLERTDLDAYIKNLRKYAIATTIWGAALTLMGSGLLFLYHMRIILQ